MKDYVSFPVYDSKDINANIETLQKLLENTGIAILYEKNQDPFFEKLNLGLLQFRWDADVLQKNSGSADPDFMAGLKRQRIPEVTIFSSNRKTWSTAGIQI